MFIHKEADGSTRIILDAGDKPLVVELPGGTIWTIPPDGDVWKYLPDAAVR